MIFDHLGLVVNDLAGGRDKLSRLLPIDGWSEEIADPGIGVWVQFGRDASGFRYELVAPLAKPSPVCDALKSGRNILNHVAYRVTDLDRAAAHLRTEGAIPLGPAKPAVAFTGARVMFFLTPMKFICELVETQKSIV
jgi:methylmalonyl-CoA/ethylmalonyl-CoA epimerase